MTISAVSMYHHPDAHNGHPVKPNLVPQLKGLARYNWINELGDGTFGSVHLYRTKDTHELVAIKV